MKSNTVIDHEFPCSFPRSTVTPVFTDTERERAAMKSRGKQQRLFSGSGGMANVRVHEAVKGGFSASSRTLHCNSHAVPSNEDRAEWQQQTIICFTLPDTVRPMSVRKWGSGDHLEPTPAYATWTSTFKNLLYE